MATPKKPTTPAAKAETKAAVYIRVSTEEQVDGYGLAAQLDKCRAMCTVKGWPVIATYEDAGISGTKGTEERPALASLLAAVTAGEVNAVVVAALDRLGRKTTLVLDLVEEMNRAGAEIVSVKEQLDTSTPAGRFVLTMFAALAELERETIVERTTAGRNQRGKVDGEKGGRLPYGYTRGPAEIVIDSKAASVVRRIFQLRAAGLTLRDIAFDVQGLCDSPRGGKWGPEAVRLILLNEPAYRGGPRNDSPVNWPAILA